MIAVKFFGKLGDIAGEDIQLEPAGLSSVADVLAYLSKETPEIYQEVTAPQVLIAVNQEIVTSEHSIKSGDEVAFLPPVTGG